MAGQVLGELVTRELVIGHDAVDHGRTFEHREVPIHRALSELGPSVEDLGNGERPERGAKRVDDRDPVRGRPLLGPPQSPFDLVGERRGEPGRACRPIADSVGPAGGNRMRCGTRPLGLASGRHVASVPAS